MKNPVHIFSKRNNIWDTVAREIQSAIGIDVFLDYDGTLTPIRRTPSAAILSKKTENILRRLTHLRGVRVAIVTGRSMEDIRTLVNVENLEFAANHGFQIYKNGTEWIHPQAMRQIQRLSRLYLILRNTLIGYPKAIIENKQFTVSIHYRNIALKNARLLKSLATKTVKAFDPTMRITRGKKVLEVRPQIDWGKGKAVMKMMHTDKSRLHKVALFIGDDTTDEDVFREMGIKGITIHVGKSTSTLARYFVMDVEDVKRLLRSIISLRTKRSGHRSSEK